MELRRKVIELNEWAVIGGDMVDISEIDLYPETKLQKAYCSLLWELDNLIRATPKPPPT